MQVGPSYCRVSSTVLHFSTVSLKLLEPFEVYSCHTIQCRVLGGKVAARHYVGREDSYVVFDWRRSWRRRFERHAEVEFVATVHLDDFVFCECPFPCRRQYRRWVRKKRVIWVIRLGIGRG